MRNGIVAKTGYHWLLLNTGAAVIGAKSRHTASWQVIGSRRGFDAVSDETVLMRKPISLPRSFAQKMSEMRENLMEDSE